MRLYREIIRENRVSTVVVLVLGITSSFAMVYAGYSLAWLFTAYEYEGDRFRAIFLTFWVVLGIWLAAMLIDFLYQLAKAWIQQRIKNDIRTRIGAKIASMDYQELTGRDSGSYVSWLTGDVDQIYSQSFASLFSGVTNLAATIFSLGALLHLGWVIGVAAVILLIIISILPQCTNRWLKRVNVERSAAMEVSTEAFKDTVMGSGILFLANLRSCISERILAASRNLERANFHHQKVNVAVQTIISSVSLIGQLVLNFVALTASVLGMSPTGAVFSVGNLAGTFFNSAGAVVKCFLNVRASKPLWEKFQMEETDSAEDLGRLTAIPFIRLEDLSFRYQQKWILQDCNQIFQAGGKYAVVGESGSGKTTLLKIMMGLLPGYEGRVYYGEQEQREFPSYSLRQNIAYVEQQVYLFQDTLRFNVTLGEAYSDKEVWEVLKKCCLSEYAASLPEGLDTLIAENGKNLSGGQRQRIALARALIRKVPYVILDEGTSALDQSNATEIEKRLLEMEELGVILVTHHLQEDIREKMTAVYNL